MHIAYASVETGVLDKLTLHDKSVLFLCVKRKHPTI